MIYIRNNIDTQRGNCLISKCWIGNSAVQFKLFRNVCVLLFIRAKFQFDHVSWFLNIHDIACINVNLLKFHHLDMNLWLAYVSIKNRLILFVTATKSLLTYSIKWIRANTTNNILSTEYFFYFSFFFWKKPERFYICDRFSTCIYYYQYDLI